MKTTLKEFCDTLQSLLGSDFVIEGCDFNHMGDFDGVNPVTMGLRLHVTSADAELLRAFTRMV
jgi:hypothetical protein